MKLKIFVLRKDIICLNLSDEQLKKRLKDMEENQKRIIDLESKLLNYINGSNEESENILIGFIGGYILGGITVILILVSR